MQNKVILSIQKYFEDDEQYLSLCYDTYLWGILLNFPFIFQQCRIIISMA